MSIPILQKRKRRLRGMKELVSKWQNQNLSSSQSDPKIEALNYNPYLLPQPTSCVPPEHFHTLQPRAFARLSSLPSSIECYLLGGDFLALSYICDSLVPSFRLAVIPLGGRDLLCLSSLLGRPLAFTTGAWQRDLANSNHQITAFSPNTFNMLSA